MDSVSVCYNAADVFFNILGESPSGKATGSEPVIRGFESLLPSQDEQVLIDPPARARGNRMCPVCITEESGCPIDIN